MMRRDVFQAIADPTRRYIINLVANNSLNLNAIAGNFDMSRPAISQHIKVLTECGLIQINQQGRERYCEAKLDSLREVAEWVEQYRAFWAERFHALDFIMDEIKMEAKQADKDKEAEKKKKRKKKKHKK